MTLPDPVPEADAQAFFDERASRYLGESRWITDAELAADLIEPLHSGTRVLDVCCGPSVLATAARRRGGFAVGLDLSPSMLLHGAAETARVCGDAHRLPFLDKSFDLAICRQGLHYARDPGAVVREMIRVAAQEIRLSNVVMLRALDLPFWQSYASLVTPARQHYFLEGELTTLAEEQGCKPVRRRTFDYQTSVFPSIEHLPPPVRRAVFDLFRTQPEIISSSYDIRRTEDDVRYVVRWESVHATVP